MNGEPVHHLSISCMIGMNSSSQYKEGAWAFLLSDAVQNQKTADDLGKFSVRKDAFENYLVNDSYWQPGDRISSRYGQPEESDIQAVRDMIENGVYQHSYNFNDPIDMILTEEGYGFLEGDFSAEETANKIHSRVQLYLDEM